MEIESNSDEKIFQKFISVLSCEIFLTNEIEHKQKDVHFEEIGYLINNLERFICASSSTLSKGQVISKLSEFIVSLGLIPKVDNDDKDLGPEHFPHVAEYAAKCFEYFKILIQEVANLDLIYKQQFFINATLLHTTYSKKQPWAPDALIRISLEFEKDILRCSRHQHISSLLTDNNFCPTIFKGALKKLRPCLLKDTWMLYPSAAPLFTELLYNIKHPHLEDYLPDVLPPAFMFVSYHKPDMQIMGIGCFNHILGNVPQTLIKLDGKEDAIYHCLFPRIYSKELKVISSIYRCLIKLPMMNPQKSQQVIWGEFDKVFNHLLFSLQLESDLQMKRVLLAYILIFSEKTTPFKHLKRIMDNIKQTITDKVCPNASCQILALKILCSIIKSCWPRMSKYCLETLILILELHVNEELLSKYNEDERNEINTFCDDCLILLKNACSETFKSVTLNVIEDFPDLPEAKYLRNVLAKSR